MGDAICKFGNLCERDMDMLFLECLLTDNDFVKLFLEKIGLADKPFEVKSVALSETEAGLGESDITMILDVDGTRIGVLIEDKIDAPAMPEQCNRYDLRAETAESDGKYSSHYVFIVCPEKYRIANSEAKNYKHFISYEVFRDHFAKKTDMQSKLRYMQFKTAIDDAASGKDTIMNEAAIAFFRKYKSYMDANHPTLDIRNKDGTNAWWPHYGTEYGNAYIYHKVSDGFVDLTFPGGAKQLETMMQIARWLNAHGLQNVKAVKTGKAASLRLTVPILNQKEPFEKADINDVEKCFAAIQELSDFAGILAKASKFI